MNCRAPKKNNGSAKESMNVTENTSDALILSVNSSVESRILDFGASFHYTSHHEIMENYFSDDFNKVHMADDETLKIMGKGDIQVKLPNEIVWKLKDVRFIPSLKRNLISLGQLDQDGYCTTFTGSEWKITKEAMVIAHGKKNGTLYVTFSLEIIIVIEKLDEKLKIWHQRLSHMSELERDEGSCFKEEAARSKISRHRSMRGLYFWENESGQFLKDRQSTQNREVRASSHKHVGAITNFIYLRLIVLCHLH